MSPCSSGCEQRIAAFVRRIGGILRALHSLCKSWGPMGPHIWSRHVVHLVDDAFKIDWTHSTFKVLQLNDIQTKRLQLQRDCNIAFEPLPHQEAQCLYFDVLKSMWNCCWNKDWDICDAIHQYHHICTLPFLLRTKVVITLFSCTLDFHGAGISQESIRNFALWPHLGWTWTYQRHKVTDDFGL